MAMTMTHGVDPKQELTDKLGDLTNVEIFNTQVMVAVYIRPNKTAGGIILTSNTTDEDKYQGKIGLVVKKGNNAFVDPKGEWFSGAVLNIGDWVIFRPADGWSLDVNGVLCRILDDTAIRGRVDRPDRIW